MPRGLTAVAGLSVGHFTDSRRPTGCTVVLAEGGAVCGVDVRGAAPGTRETELLAPVNTVEKVHAVLLAGGSAFGLDAAGGVMRWLDERGVGIPFGPIRADGRQATVPIVPAAILFDLSIGDSSIRPDAAAGYAACAAATREAPAEGNVGAGAGAMIGKLFGIDRAMRGGLGTRLDHGRRRHGGGAGRGQRDGRRGRSGERPDRRRRAGRGRHRLPRHDGGVSSRRVAGRAGRHGRPPTARRARPRSRSSPPTPIVTKPEATKMAQMAHDGLARTIRPIHTMSDGDIVFALGTGASGQRAHTTLLGALAADVLAEAVLRAVRAATALAGPGLPSLPAARDLPGTGRTTGDTA